jgi:GNAT superfamily N-acetyltransferase
MTAPGDSPKCADHRIEPAVPGDVDALSQVIADAFFDLAVSQWLIGDPGARRKIFPGFFRIYVERALTEGAVFTTPARDATALWIFTGSDEPAEPPQGYHDRLAAVTGPHLARFQALDKAFERHHPTGMPHEHLAILAVRPNRQRLGIGTALLNARHAILDRDGIPAYLEASDSAKREIYRGHRYIDLGEPIELLDGPQMYPMIRFPRDEAEVIERQM